MSETIPQQMPPLRQIIQGDNVEVLKTFPDNCIDLTVTSPPYDNLRTYKGYSFNFEGVAKELYRVTKEGGVVVWVVGDKVEDWGESGTSLKQALAFQETGFKRRTIIYQKEPRYPNQYFYRSGFEFMFVLLKGSKPRVFNPIKDVKSKSSGVRQAGNRNEDGTMTRRPMTINPYHDRSNVWFYDVGYGTTTRDYIAYEHPAIFPDALAEDHIKSWSNEGDIILDPFAGSGTTLKMAEKLNRKWVGIEISKEYIDIANKRLAPPMNQSRLI